MSIRSYFKELKEKRTKEKLLGRIRQQKAEAAYYKELESASISEARRKARLAARAKVRGGGGFSGFMTGLQKFSRGRGMFA